MLRCGYCGNDVPEQGVKCRGCGATRVVAVSTPMVNHGSDLVITAIIDAGEIIAPQRRVMK